MESWLREGLGNTEIFRADFTMVGRVRPSITKLELSNRWIY